MYFVIVQGKFEKGTSGKKLKATYKYLVLFLKKTLLSIKTIT